jgi:hypothetical protein
MIRADRFTLEDIETGSPWPTGAQSGNQVIFAHQWPAGNIDEHTGWLHTGKLRCAKHPPRRFGQRCGDHHNIAFA